MEEYGPTTVTLSKPTGKQAGRTLPAAFAVEKMDWKGRVGSASPHNPDMKSLLVFVGVGCAKASELVAALLSVCGELIAVQIGRECRDRDWILKIGHNVHWRKTSPGMQLMSDSVRYVCDKALGGVEFLGVDEVWLSAWTKDAQVLKNGVYTPFPVNGVRGAWRAVKRELGHG